MSRPVRPASLFLTSPWAIRLCLDAGAMLAPRHKADGTRKGMRVSFGQQSAPWHRKVRECLWGAGWSSQRECRCCYTTPRVRHLDAVERLRHHILAAPNF